MSPTRPDIVIHPRAVNDLALPGGDVVFRPAFLDRERAARLTRWMLDEAALPWRDDRIVMFGRQVRQPRRTLWIADEGIGYCYSGLTLTPVAWPARLAALREQLETILAARFNSVLLNLYRDGRDYMGWHRDNERELGAEPVIASLSLGATRHFDLRHREYRSNKLPVQRFELAAGDLIVMRGATQANWYHRVPRRTAVAGARINLSFRWTAPPAAHARPRSRRS